MYRSCTFNIRSYSECYIVKYIWCSTMYTKYTSMYIACNQITKFSTYRKTALENIIFLINPFFFSFNLGCQKNATAPCFKLNRVHQYLTKSWVWPYICVCVFEIHPICIFLLLSELSVSTFYDDGPLCALDVEFSESSSLLPLIINTS